MERRLDLAGWRRRQHFEFFRDFEQPFWSVCFEVDVTRLLEALPKEKSHFFLASLFLSIRAANGVPAFRYRMRGRDQVIEHDRIHASSTILREDETFGFGYFHARTDSFSDFVEEGRAEIARVRRTTELADEPDHDDRVYYSVLPWLSFTSFSHARRLPSGDSAPRIVFGKVRSADGCQLMPVSVEVHHALVDGLDVGRFRETFVALLESPSSSLA